MIINELRPVGPLTSYDPMAARRDISSDYRKTRCNLANLCLVSKALNYAMAPHLYHTILLQSQMELALFFRALVLHPNNRFTVRSFAWAGNEKEHDTKAISVARTHLGSLRWAPNSGTNPADNSIVPSGTEILEILRLVLCYISEVKSLFMLFGRDNETGMCLGHEALRGWVRGIGPLLEGQSRILQKLEVMTFESDFTRQTVLEDVCTNILLNSPRLRRIEFKGAMSFREVVDKIQQLRGSRHVSESIKELVHFRATDPDLSATALAEAFPNLSTLKAEHAKNGSHLDLSRALLTGNLTTTLETLSLTTELEVLWVRKDETGIPLLALALNQMRSLKHLTTESIWLFGQEPRVAFQLSTFLPPSLVSFTLIDYWGHEFFEEPFYPPLVRSWTPHRFYTRALNKLHNECSTRFPSLRQITLASDYLYCCGITAPDHNGQARRFLPTFQDLFASIGVQFSITTRQGAWDQRQWDWANLE